MSRDRTRYPAIPFAALYDAAGGQAFTNAGGFHTWDSAAAKSTHFDYTLDQDRIYLVNNQYGFYEVDFECSYVCYNDAEPVFVYSKLYLNGAEVPGTLTVCTVQGSGEQSPEIQASHSIHCLVYLTGMDYLQVYTWTSSASSTYALANSSRLAINFVPVRGWNNSAGGRVDFRGGILR